jgi:hypothetical protein
MALGKNYKHNLIFIMLLIVVNCVMEESYNCVNCMSAALRVSFIDTSDPRTKVSGAVITVSNNQGDTIISCDTCNTVLWDRSPTDSAYQFSGGPGIYSLHFSHPTYDSFTISNIHVNQWQEVTCEHANTVQMTISVQSKSLKTNPWAILCHSEPV